MLTSVSLIGFVRRNNNSGFSAVGISAPFPVTFEEEPLSTRHIFNLDTAKRETVGWTMWGSARMHF